MASRLEGVLSLLSLFKCFSFLCKLLIIWIIVVMFAAECGFVLDVLSFWVIAGQNPPAVTGKTGNEAGSGSVCPTLALQIQQILAFLFLQQHRLAQ